jgi:hypothetical protein
MLKADANLMYIQCGLCHTCWWLDTGYGVSKRSNGADTSPPKGISSSFGPVGAT